jgi:FkbM family methyltransferase
MKKLVFRLLCNPFIGKIISIIFNYNIPNCKYGFKRYKTPKNYCNDTVRAMIFWGFYEGAEMRLIQQYLPKDIPVVELGSSLGIVSSTAIGCLNTNTPYTCVEANPYLKDFIDFNIKKHNPSKTNFRVLNAAIAYNTDGYIEMSISKNNTESSIVNSSDYSNHKTTKVKAVTLNEIIAEPYTLICDIEGAEIDVMENDVEALKNCKHLFIELHKTKYQNKHYDVSDLKNIITSKLGFSLAIADGNVFYYKK